MSSSTEGSIEITLLVHLEGDSTALMVVATVIGSLVSELSNISLAMAYPLVFDVALSVSSLTTIFVDFSVIVSSGLSIQ